MSSTSKPRLLLVMSALAFLLGSGSKMSAEQFVWQRTGGPFGGSILDLTAAVQDPDHIFAADAFGGVFESKDGGLSWVPIIEGLSVRIGRTGDNIPIRSIAVNPRDPQDLMAGSLDIRGVYRSNDGGMDWYKSALGITEQYITINSITIDPIDPGIVYAAGEIPSKEWYLSHIPGYRYDRVKGIVYKSSSGGGSWNVFWRGDDAARAVIIDPKDNRTLYLIAGALQKEPANSDYSTSNAGGVGISKSKDGGITWSSINNGLKTLSINSLAINPNDPKTILAGAGNEVYPAGAGIYVTHDAGVNWNLVHKEDLVTVTAFSVSNPRVAYAGGVNAIFRSDDGGNSWYQTTEGSFWSASGVLLGMITDLLVDPRDSNRIIISSSLGGVFVSTDGGHHFTAASKGISGMAVRGISVSAEEPGKVLASGSGGVFITYDGGSGWTGTASGEALKPEWGVLAFNPSNPREITAVMMCPGQLVNSENAGDAWWVRQSLGSEALTWSAVAYSPKDPHVVYAGTMGVETCMTPSPDLPGGGLYSSLDGGKTWKQSSSLMDASVYAISPHPTNSQVAVAATTNYQLVMTMDGGTTWAPIGGDLPANKVTAWVLYHPSDPSILWAGIHKGGLYQSRDGGATWIRLNKGFPDDMTVSDMVYDPVNPSKMYMSDQFSGVYMSIDGGASWKQIIQGLTNRSVNRLSISGDGLHLYAATDGGGVFRMDLDHNPPGQAVVPTPKPTATPLPTAIPTSIPGLATPTPVSPLGNLPIACPSVGFVFSSLLLILLFRRK